MKVLNIARVAVATCVFALASSSLAFADIVVMTSGQTVSVKAHKTEGNSVILTLRSGGQVTCDQSLIVKILPDEVPHPEPESQVAEAKPATDVPTADRGARLRESIYGELITAAAQAHGVDPVLVQALIQVESNYKPRARSNRGAMGLMQLMPATAREYKVRNAYDPKANIDAGVRKLKTLIDKWGVDLALAAYNAGEGAVMRFKGIPPYRETQNYVSRILSIAGQR